MPGFDWNGNKKRDHFDTYMDLKVMSNSSKKDADSLNDNMIDDSDGEDSIVSDDRKEIIYPEVEYEEITKIQPNDFQTELKKNMKTLEDVQKENFEREMQLTMFDAKQTLVKIKEYLMYNAKNGKCEKADEVTYVSCICDINQKYLNRQLSDNMAELKKDKETFFLFRNPNLVYKSEYYYDIKPDYRKEYDLFISSLKKLAKKEKIIIEIVLANKDELFPFPYSLNSLNSYVKLSVKATIIISGNSSYIIKTVKEKHNEKFMLEFQKNQELNKEGWAMTGKCFLVVGILVLAFVICLNAGIGKLGMGLLLIASVILGYFILKKKN